MSAKPEFPTIYTIRRQKVVVDDAVAKLYGVSTRQLNQAVRRNRDRFPSGFCFHLTHEELASLRSQNVISNGLRGGRRHPPLAFTEHGALMAATFLNSRRAVEMSVYLIRLFVQMRECIQANAEALRRLAEIDRRLVEHDAVLREIVTSLQPLLNASPEEDDRPKIGFHRGNR